jgi:hypothetical protein
MNQENNISFLLEDNESSATNEEDNNLLIAEMLREFSLDTEGEEQVNEGEESEYFIKNILLRRIFILEMKNYTMTKNIQ